MVPIDLALLSSVPLSFVGLGSPPIALALALGGTLIAATLAALPFTRETSPHRAPVTRAKPTDRPRMTLGPAGPPLAA